MAKESMSFPYRYEFTFYQDGGSGFAVNIFSVAVQQV